jgi:hypothetical protein
MIICAADEFRCAHHYVATKEEARLLFVCHRCGHRAETLPLHRDRTFGRVVPFPPRAAAARLLPTSPSDPFTRQSA